MIIIQLILYCLLFWLMCWLGTGTDEKNIKSYTSYPDEVQEIVKNNPALSDKIKPANPVGSFVGNAVLFTVVLFIFGIFIRTESFWQNFLDLSIMGQTLNLFDLLVIDLLWWRNSKRIRFSGTADNPELYRNPRKHIVSFVKAIFMFEIAAAVSGLILCFI